MIWSLDDGGRRPKSLLKRVIYDIFGSSPCPLCRERYRGPLGKHYNKCPKTKTIHLGRTSM